MAHKKNMLSFKHLSSNNIIDTQVVTVFEQTSTNSDAKQAKSVRSKHSYKFNLSGLLWQKEP